MDLLAAVFALRAESFTPGTEVHIPIFVDHKNWEMVAWVVGHQQITTRAGRFETTVVCCRTRLAGKLAQRGDLLVWLSDDDRRLPVRIEAPFAVGKIEASLTSYRTGPIVLR